jgi:dipeptidyl aminopeptidase/acylaminoacyl peptidase
MTRLYTERYMRTPKENPEGYGDNAITRASKLSGALLICHGLADDNVHPQNTFEYAEALVQATKTSKRTITPTATTVSRVVTPATICSDRKPNGLWNK